MPSSSTLLKERCMHVTACKWLKAGGKCGAKTNTKGKTADITEVYDCPRGRIQDGKFVPAKGVLKAMEVKR